jgi:GEVED domain/Putative metal-binding motif/Secretion system C-terminal sorting domain
MKKIYFFLFALSMIWQTNAQISGSTFSISSGSYVPITGGVNSASVQPTAFDSNVVGALPIGFTFNYNGLPYTQFGYNVNGWISMGAAVPLSSSFPLSLGTTNNVISGMSADWIFRQHCVVSTTLGSPVLTVTSGVTSNLTIGSAVTGTGVTSGATILSVTATTITLSSNAISTGTGRHLRVYDGGVRYETVGVSPNRKLVVQFYNFSRFSSTATTGDKINFQIVLNETSNNIDFIYGSPAPSLVGTVTTEVGLRGATITDFKNITTTTNWSTAIAGATNASSCSYSNTVFPASGTKITWVQPSCFPPTLNAVSAITTTTATASWVAAASASSGYDYEVRTSGAGGSGAVGLVSSGSTATTSVNLTGLAVSTNYTVYVRSNCGSGSFSNWAPISFVTLCNPITVFPYTEGFEGIVTAGTLPTCLTSTPAVSVAGKVQSYIAAATVTNSALIARTGTRFTAVFWNPAAKGTIYSAPVQLNAGTSYNAEVFYRTDGVAWSTVGLYYGTSATEAAMTNTIASVTNGAATVYTPINGTFTPAVSGVYYIGIQAFNATTAPNYCVFDDFSLTQLPPCAGTPNNGVVTIGSTSGCSGLNVALAATGVSSGSGLSYQWQSSTDNVNFTAISGATAPTYALSTVPGTTYYRLATTCTPSASTSFSNTVNYVGTNCTYNTSYTTGATMTSIMPANGGSGLAYPGWQGTPPTNADDIVSTTVSLAGTTFVYQSAPVTGFQACSNGWMTFNTANTSNQWTNSLVSTGQNKVLAPFWDDMVCTGNVFTGKDASMRYSIQGTLGSGSAIITAEWAGMEKFGVPGPNMNFQVKLYESDNHIEYVYGTFEGFDGTTGASGYSYSLGYNGTNPAGTGSVDRFALQTENANHFSASGDAATLQVMPVCNTMYSFTPGTYTGLTSAPAAVVPANDNSAGAIDLTVLPGPITTYCGTYYTSKNATDSGAGLPTCLTTAATAGGQDDDVWFKFTTGPATDYTIKLRSSSNYDGVLQLLNASLAPISCANSTTVGSIETINATGLISGGTTYYLRVFHNGATIGTSSGEFSLAINQVIPLPTNDEITAATALTVAATCSITNSQYPATVVATASATLPAACNTADDDVWYSFVASSASNTVDVQSGLGYNASVQILSSSDNTATGTLTELACVNNTSTGGLETYSGPFVGGNTYFVRVYHAGSGAGSGKFTICVSAPVPTCAAGYAPVDLATAVARNPTLSWTASAIATSYDVHFGTTATPAFIANQTGLTYTPAALLANTTYYWKVVAKNGNGAAVGCTTQSFTTGAVFVYCTPTYTTGKTAGDLIANIVIPTTTLSNNTGTAPTNPSFTYFTGQPNYTASLQAGASYTITASVGSFSNQNIAAWVDYNDDGTFAPSERIGFTTASIGALGTASFTVSLACNPPLGLHRMRIRDVYATAGNAIDPCANYGWGETEDYDITITTADPCPTPKLGLVSAITTTTANLGWTLGCAETAWDLKVQLAGAGVPPNSSSLVGTLVSTTSAYPATGLTAGTNYEFYVRAECSSNTLYSSWAGPYTFATTPLAPGCATLVAPTSGTTNVNASGTTFSWTAPAVTATQSAATSYQVYTGTTSGALTLLGTVTGTSAIINSLAYSTTYYWSVTAVNAAGSAVGCTSEFSFTTQADPFLPYCSNINFTTGVEPITSVTFAGIANTSSAALTAPDHENFISITGNVTTATTYPISVKGNTDGNFVAGVHLYADWNHDNDFGDAGESYYVGPIANSTGLDAVVATSNIAVPEGALPGLTRIRIKKQYLDTAVTSDPCLAGGYGQMEDYTLNVTSCIPTLWYADADNDGYGDADVTLLKCLQPAGYINTNSTDCLDTNPNVNPGKPEVAFNGLDDNCDGQQDEGFQITTQIVSTQCGTTLPSIGTVINVNNYPLSTLITGYRYKVVGPGGTQILNKTVPHFTIQELPTFDFATTYTVTCQLQRNNIWLGYYGPSCTVTTPNVVAVGLSQIVSPACGSTLASMSSIISTTSLGGVVGYRFEVTNTTPGYTTGPGAVQVIDRTVQWFKMTQLPIYVLGCTYSIRVAVKTVGATSYGAFGNPCTLNSYAVPTITNCGLPVAVGGTVSTTSLGGVTQYTFEVTGPSGVQLINRTIQYFFVSAITGYSPSTPYTIRVAVTTTGVQSPFGSPCTINPGVAARFGDATATSATTTGTEFKAVGYPNPFETNFTLNVTTTSDEKVQVAVYDMIGKQLESKEVTAADANALEVGANYPSGVYNVVVSQGANVKSLRMIKR